MTLESRIQSIVTNKLDTYGFSSTIYLAPSYTYDDEGQETAISKGTGTTAKLLIHSPRGEMITPEMEGVDLQYPLTCYVKYDVGTIEENDLIKFGTEYFKITNIKKHPLGSASITFYELEIERIQPQSIVS